MDAKNNTQALPDLKPKGEEVRPLVSWVNYLIQEMKKRYTDADKWNKWFRSLEPYNKLFWLYINDACDHVGIWEVDIELAQINTGFDLNEDELIRTFQDKIFISEDGGKWWISDFIKLQYNKLLIKETYHPKDPTPKYIERLQEAGVWELYQNIYNEHKYNYLSPTKEGLKPTKEEDKEEDKEKEKDKDKDKEDAKQKSDLIQGGGSPQSESADPGNEYQKKSGEKSKKPPESLKTPSIKDFLSETSEEAPF